MTSEYVPPGGPRFSQLYVERASAGQDSSRLRVRIAALFQRRFANVSLARDVLEIRLGANIDHVQGSYDIAKFLRICPLRDFYDFVTVYRQALEEEFKRTRYTSDQILARTWTMECQTAFVEENVAFRVDNAGVVRPLVDTEFDRNLSTLLAGLSDRRLAAVRLEVETSISELERPQPATKAAIRSMFEALEIYSKIVVTSYNVQKLDASVVEHHILPIIQGKPGMFKPSQDVAHHLAMSLIDWIKGAHLYRHGQNTTEPAPPPLDLAVVYVSMGAAYLRWIVENTSHKLASQS